MTQRELIGYGTAIAGILCLALAAWLKGSFADAVLAVGTGLSGLASVFGYVNKPPAAAAAPAKT